MSEDKSYSIYIVECSDGSYYTGITNSIAKRLRQHNGEISGGAIYTSRKRPVKLVHTETYQTHLEAARREVEIKQMTRVQKQRLFLKD